MSYIIYSSKYGFAKRYAEWIGEELGSNPVDCKERNLAQLEKEDLVLFGSSVYVGTFRDIGILKKIMDAYPHKRFIFFGTCLSDPNKEPDREVLHNSLEKSLGPENYGKAKVFLFRGGIDYKRLNIMDRLMMKVFMTFIKKNETESQEDIQFIENYREKMDFSSKDFIAPLVEYARQEDQS